ncbi:hypothetical protein Dimus_036786 [Dionaea muscipula]
MRGGRAAIGHIFLLARGGEHGHGHSRVCEGHAAGGHGEGHAVSSAAWWSCGQPSPASAKVLKRPRLAIDEHASQMVFVWPSLEAITRPSKQRAQLLERATKDAGGRSCPRGDEAVGGHARSAGEAARSHTSRDQRSLAGTVPARPARLASSRARAADKAAEAVPCTAGEAAGAMPRAATEAGGLPCSARPPRLAGSQPPPRVVSERAGGADRPSRHHACGRLLARCMEVRTTIDIASVAGSERVAIGHLFLLRA